MSVTTPTPITPEHVEKNLGNVTPEEIGRCHLIIASDGTRFHLVQSERDLFDSNGKRVEYKVSYDGERGFECTCPSGQHAFWNIKHPSMVCKHVRWAVACELEEKAAPETDVQDTPILDENEVQVPAPAPTPQPRLLRRWNAWEMRQQTFCCGKWWNGDYCYYGNHCLQSEVPPPAPAPQPQPKVEQETPEPEEEGKQDGHWTAQQVQQTGRSARTVLVEEEQKYQELVAFWQRSKHPERAKQIAYLEAMIQATRESLGVLMQEEEQAQKRE